jgi:hypothetical protein
MWTRPPWLREETDKRLRRRRREGRVCLSNAKGAGEGSAVEDIVIGMQSVSLAGVVGGKGFSVTAGAAVPMSSRKALAKPSLIGCAWSVGLGVRWVCGERGKECHGTAAEEAARAFPPRQSGRERQKKPSLFAGE